MSPACIPQGFGILEVSGIHGVSDVSNDLDYGTQQRMGTGYRLNPLIIPRR
jgi:hypothetical protein